MGPEGRGEAFPGGDRGLATRVSSRGGAAPGPTSRLKRLYPHMTIVLAGLPESEL